MYKFNKGILILKERLMYKFESVDFTNFDMQVFFVVRVYFVYRTTC